jgi:hypothetical protein
MERSSPCVLIHHYSRDFLPSSLAINRIANLENPQSADLLQNVAWAVSGLCRGKPSFQSVQRFVTPLVTALLRLQGDSEEIENIRIDIIWALSYISELDRNSIQAIVNSGVISTLNHVLERTSNKKLLVPTVRTLGNVSVGDDEQTDYLIRAGFLDHAYLLINYPSVSLGGSVFDKFESTKPTFNSHVYLLHSHRKTCKRTLAGSCPTLPPEPQRRFSPSLTSPVNVVSSPRSSRRR